MVEPFKETGIEGEIAVCRECLIDGDIQAEGLDEFWQVREDYLSSAYPKEETFYRENVISEFEKLLSATEKDEINLWFEHELFCQVNMWFCLDFLKDSKAEIYRVAPIVKDGEDIWKGFGFLKTDELKDSFKQREKFAESDVELGSNLWKAYQKRDFEKLKMLSETDSKCFPYLKAVCNAAIEQEKRPKATLEKIMAEGESGFGKVFQKFNEIEAIYGFGDLQVKKLYDDLTGAQASRLQ